MSNPTEQIDNYLHNIPRGKYGKFIKKATSKFRRKQIKQYLRNFNEDKPEPFNKQYKGWTT